MLELGVGDNARKQEGYEYYAVDCVETAFTTAVCKVGFEPLPYEDNYFDFILGDQFLEHIPRIGSRIKRNDGNAVLPLELEEFNPLINCLNECWRVAKPGASIQFNVPKWDSVEMQQDPTHCNACPPQMWVYWQPEDQWNLKSSYGIKGSFRLDETIDGGWYDVFKLTAIK
jgi:SAM-dependent methyltransferase